eukprot:1529885-Amphidinium_carterae.1
MQVTGLLGMGTSLTRVRNGTLAQTALHPDWVQKCKILVSCAAVGGNPHISRGHELHCYMFHCLCKIGEHEIFGLRVTGCSLRTLSASISLALLLRVVNRDQRGRRPDDGKRAGHPEL